MNHPWTNWSGSERATSARVVRPRSVDEVAEAVRTAARDGLPLKAVGSGHSFTAAAATDGVRVELADLATPVTVDGALVTVPAGMRLRELNATLAAHGLALPNLGDIDVQTISGALATGTHGTGGTFGCLSTFVEGLELVTGSGDVLRCSATEHRDVFDAARVNIGALGVVTQVTLRCVPAFTLRAEERPASLSAVLGEMDDLVGQNDHFEFYWFPYTSRVQVKLNNRVPTSDAPLPSWRRWLDDEFLSNTLFGATSRLGRAVPRTVPTLQRIASRALSARSYTAPSYEVFCSPRRVRFNEMEYGLPRAALREAFTGLQSIVDSLPFRVAFPVEVRFTAADDIWLSHGFGRDSAYIAIHQFVGMPYSAYFKRFETLAESLDGRPHWGKMHWRSADSLAAVYPRFRDFVAVRDNLDPARVFANPYLSRVIG